MISTRQSAALYPLGLDFDPFLYAQVGDDQQGGPLSVVSALARVGVDPWDEAASLARLPLDAAVHALSALLARLPVGSGKPVDPVQVATRLVALLPHASSRPARPTSATTVKTGAAKIPKRWLMVLLYVVILLLFVGSQLLKQHPLPPAPAPAIGQPAH